MLKPDESTFTVRLLIPGVVLCLALFSVSHRAVKSNTSMPSQQTEKRELENRVPKHVPLKINLRPEKEAAFRKLDNERWVRDLELEIKNTGDKSVYSLEFALDMPDMTPNTDRHAVFLMHYGRDKLLLFETPLTSEDVPIKPGETVVLRVNEMDAEAWEHFRQGPNGQLPWQLPKKVTLLFARLNFGDGTGFDGGGAEPWPQAKRPTLVSLSPFLRTKAMINGKGLPQSLYLN